MSKNGIIFNIQRFSTSDGPGIRTTIFLKGCNLRCKWCHNPESYKANYQLMWDSKKCIQCKKCSAICPVGIEYDNRINNIQCTLCKKCVNTCFHKALKFFGEQKSSDDIVSLIKKDINYYNNSGGGITISGGEALLQTDFVLDIFKKTSQLNIHNALDTALDIPFSNIKSVMKYTNLFLIDLKTMNNEKHYLYTGVSNNRILENATKLFKTGKEIHIRIPVIENINDDLDNLHILLDFIEGYDNITKVELLPYHDLGVNKANMIGTDVEIFNSPSKQRMEELEKLIKTRRI